jgi:hypothetical protein
MTIKCFNCKHLQTEYRLALTAFFDENIAFAFFAGLNDIILCQISQLKAACDGL